MVDFFHHAGWGHAACQNAKISLPGPSIQSNNIQNLQAYRSCLSHHQLQNTTVSRNLNQNSVIYKFRIELDCTSYVNKNMAPSHELT